MEATDENEELRHFREKLATHRHRPLVVDSPGRWSICRAVVGCGVDSALELSRGRRGKVVDDPKYVNLELNAATMVSLRVE
jgi:hypothetical protein